MEDEKVSKNDAKIDVKWCQNCPKSDRTIDFFAKRWFCQNYAFTAVKACFLRWGSKNQFKIYPKTVKKWY